MHGIEQETRADGGSPQVRPDRAPLLELFHSVQGEGRHAGLPTTFVRVGGCPLRCTYCDTPQSHRAPAAGRWTVAGRPREVRNPVPAGRAHELVAELRSALGLTAAAAPWVSITGGEPLLYPGFVRGLGTALRAAGLSVHLETAALDASALRHALPGVDHVSADWKLPGTLGPAPGDPGGGDPRAAHLACVAAAVEHGASVDVKVVLVDGVRAADLDDLCVRLAPWRAGIQVVLQPVTPVAHAAVRAPAAGDVLGWLGRVRATGLDARVLPQLHPVLRLP